MFLENLKLAFNSMFTNKMRTFLSLLGIVIGVGSVVTIMNLGESVKRSITDSMNIGGVDEVSVIPTGANAVFSEEFAYTFQDNVLGIEIHSLLPTHYLGKYKQTLPRIQHWLLLELQILHRHPRYSYCL